MKIKDIKKDFYLYIYAVADCEININHEAIITPGTRFYTISYNVEDCNEYIENKLYDDNESHYIQWCALRNISPQSPESWDTYFDVVLYDNIPYKVVKMPVSFTDLLALVRLFEHCIPIGCSFDREVEKLYYKEHSYNPNNPVQQDNSDLEKIVQ